MKPFTAPISDRSRELYGTYMRRYEDIPSMRPFDADISDRRRELFGEYMRRYEEVPSMQPFDADLDDRSRNLFGDYRSRWSTQKVGARAGSSITDANGVNWVDMAFSPIGILSPTANDLSIYRVELYLLGVPWAGTPRYRILIDDVKVYPFLTEDDIQDGVTVYLGTLSTTVRTGEVCKVQIRSTNAGDTGAGGQRVYGGLDIGQHTK